MKKKGLYQWLHQFGVASSIAMGVWVTTAGAATLNVPSTSTTGVFNVSYKVVGSSLAFCLPLFSALPLYGIIKEKSHYFLNPRLDSQRSESIHIE